MRLLDPPERITAAIIVHPRAINFACCRPRLGVADPLCLPPAFWRARPHPTAIPPLPQAFLFYFLFSASSLCTLCSSLCDLCVTVLLLLFPLPCCGPRLLRVRPICLPACPACPELRREPRRDRNAPTLSLRRFLARRASQRDLCARALRRGGRIAPPSQTILAPWGLILKLLNSCTLELFNF